LNTQPNILYVMTDQQRFDTIAALGNGDIHTPNLDRMVSRGLTFNNAYSPCPVCVAARYTIRTGCSPLKTRVFSNGIDAPAPGQADAMKARCGPYLASEMSTRGYRTFGIGKFHSNPWNEELGYQSHLHSEEIYGSPEQRTSDAYASFISQYYPSYDFIEGLMGERTEMYYMPQMSPMPAHCTVESWAADRAIEHIRCEDGRPFFGFLSFIGPHPPLAPPIPFNRIYDPDRMPNPVRGELEIDHMDEQIPWMNYSIWAEDINDAHARVLKARYYGEVSYIDQCLGRVLDAVEEREDADNTLICFFADHGDHMGDHSAWQKESFFDVSCRIPFLLSWPDRLEADVRREELVSLTDLYAIATGASGDVIVRDGWDVLGGIDEGVSAREALLGMYGSPGTPRFKIMVRQGNWKYIYLANGGREQLFNLKEDPEEIHQKAESNPHVVDCLRRLAIDALDNRAGEAALYERTLRAFEYERRPDRRVYQFDRSRGVVGFPERPEDVLT